MGRRRRFGGRALSVRLAKLNGVERVFIICSLSHNKVYVKYVSAADV